MKAMSEEMRQNMASDCGSLWRVDWSEVAAAFAPEEAETSAESV